MRNSYRFRIPGNRLVKNQVNLEANDNFPFSSQGAPMISPTQVEAMIKLALPDAETHVQDLTGGGDHYQVTVISSQFTNKRLVQQHQLVYGALKEAMSSEAIHALALKTYTPEAWAESARSA